MNPQVRSVAAIVAEAQTAVAECEEVLREVVEAGWWPTGAGVEFCDARHASRTIVGGFAKSGLDGTGTLQTMLLRVEKSSPNGTVESYVNVPGGVPGVENIPTGGKIPTPDEAYEAWRAYWRKFHWAEEATE